MKSILVGKRSHFILALGPANKPLEGQYDAVQWSGWKEADISV